MKNRRIVILVLVLLLVCSAYFLRPIHKPTLYDSYAVSDTLTVQAGFNKNRTEVWYAIANLTDQDIDYDFAVLEYWTENGWQEVPTRAFQRQSEIGRTADQTFFPADKTTAGCIPLTDLRMPDIDHYRIVIPLTDTNTIAVGTFFSEC